MITSIQGTLTSATPLHAIVELNGFGYEVNIPVTTAERLPQAGATVKLHTHVIYREDAQTLYGFATPSDRDFFRLMIEHVTGIGPKSALTIMSRLSLICWKARSDRATSACWRNAPASEKRPPNAWSSNSRPRSVNHSLGNHHRFQRRAILPLRLR